MMSWAASKLAKASVTCAVHTDPIGTFFMSKRKRTAEECLSANIEHMSPENSRRGESVVGGTLRLNVASCLKPIEAEILDTMLEAVKLSKSGTVVRVAGGWVRDKLLGLEVRERPWPIVLSRTCTKKPAPRVVVRSLPAGAVGASIVRHSRFVYL